MTAKPSGVNDIVWITELVITFADGRHERFPILRTKSGSLKPPEHATPAPWTKLAFHKCDCCPLAETIEFCPAAQTLEMTIMKFRGRDSNEHVTATAIDSHQRHTVVDWSLKDVGSAFVQMAVFFSRCPIGKRFQPMLSNLRPFPTTQELARHLIGYYLLKHHGKYKASSNEIMTQLLQLRSVFQHLSKRLSATTDAGSAMDSIGHLDQFAKLIVESLQEIYNEFAEEMQWDDSRASKKTTDLLEIPAGENQPRRLEDSWVIRRLKHMFNIEE